MNRIREAIYYAPQDIERKALAALNQMEAELAALRADAERYRAARTALISDGEFNLNQRRLPETPAEVDEMFDELIAAISAQGDGE